MSEIDCGDNSCRFASRKGGMRTNGGCRCTENAGFSRSSFKALDEMLREVLKLRAENEKLKREALRMETQIQYSSSKRAEAEEERDFYKDSAEYALRIYKGIGFVVEAERYEKAKEERGYE